MDEAIPIILTQPVVFFQLQLFKKRTGMVETALFFFCCNQGQVSTCSTRLCLGSRASHHMWSMNT